MQAGLGYFAGGAVLKGLFGYHYRSALTTRGDCAYAVYGFALLLQCGNHCIRTSGASYYNHAYAVVKCAVHLYGINTCGALQPCKQLALWPATCLQMGG